MLDGGRGDRQQRAERQRSTALTGGAAVYTDSTEATLATINVMSGALFLTGSNSPTLSQSVVLNRGLLEAATGAVTNDLTIAKSTTIEGFGAIDAYATIDDEKERRSSRPASPASSTTALFNRSC